MTSINKITKKEYPDIWDYITDDPDLHDMDHRRGSTFYVTPHYIIDRKYWPDAPEELLGTWEADTCTWSDDWGLDVTPVTLYRVQLVETEKVIIEKNWVRV